MVSETDLYIFESASKKEKDTLIIDEILNNISQEEYINVEKDLLSSNIGSDMSFPLFDSLWDYIILSHSNGLIEKILIYEQLKSEILKVDPGVVHIKVRKKAYRQVVYDLEDEFECDFIYHNKNSNNSTHSQLIHFPFRISEVAKFLISLLDQIFGIFINNNLKNNQETNEYESIVFPYPGRDDSVRPIVDEMTSNVLVVVDPRSSLPNSTGYTYSGDWDNHNVRTFNSFASIPIILAQLRIFTYLIKEATITKSLEQEITEYIAKSRDNHLQYTVQYVIQESFKGRLFDFKRATISEYIFKECSNAERVVTGSNGSMYRLIRYFARKADIDNYYIPHTITNPIERNHPPHNETAMVVSGDFDRDIMVEYFPSITLPTLVPLGRPYFEKLQNDEIPSLTTNGLKVMIATQKVEEIRDEFVIDILSSLSERQDIEKIIIKIHPAETKSHYSELFSTMELNMTDKISIHEYNLTKHIVSSDVIFTINSNVGIESMILGVPSVSYNKWEPRFPSMPYTTKGPGILLTNQDELQKFINKMDEKQLEDLSNNMTKFAKENYEPDINAANKIAKFVES